MLLAYCLEAEVSNDAVLASELYCSRFFRHVNNYYLIDDFSFLKIFYTFT